MTKRIKAADLFCGAGGTSTGLVDACREMGYEVDLTAVNHWQRAVDTHSANHPTARHFCASLDSLNPRDLFGEGELNILWASPECTHHSIARGGKPVSDQSRATAWCVIRWAEALRPDVILVENVKEFESWGPIGTNGRPMGSRKGEIFRAWVSALESIGYKVGWRVLCAADFGDPTTRRRLFVQAVRGRRKIVWPEPTHGPVSEQSELMESRKPYASAEY
jgi:DNA (cytosine-5)-methyltransferase 1